MLAVAAWMRWLHGTDLSVAPVTVDDPKAELLQTLARGGADDPRPLLGVRSTFGRLADDRELVRMLTDTLGLLSAEGLEAAVDRAVDAARPTRGRL